MSITLTAEEVRAAIADAISRKALALKGECVAAEIEKDIARRETRDIVDRYIALRADIKDLSERARELVKDLEIGRHEGSAKDLRVAMKQATSYYVQAKRTRVVTIVDKLKPRKPKKTTGAKKS